MSKWADKIIIKVRFNAQGTHIDQVIYKNDTGEKLSGEFQVSRQQVISEIKSGTTFCTATWNGKEWIKGASVGIFPVSGVEYIKTKADSTPKDNLDNLPVF